MSAGFSGGRASCPPSRRKARKSTVLLVVAVAALSFGAAAQNAAPDGTHAGHFWAVAGSFLKKSAAQSAAREVARKTGASAAILVAATPAGPTHRVALGPWPTAAEAQQAIQRLRLAGYADAWKLRANPPEVQAGASAAPTAIALPEPTVPEEPALAAPKASAPSRPRPSGNQARPAKSSPNAATALDSRTAAQPIPAPLAFEANLRTSAAFGITDASPTRQKEELALIGGIHAAFPTPRPLGLSGFLFTVRIRREGSDALVPGKPNSPSAVHHHLDAYAEAELRQAWVDLRRDDWRFRIGRQSVVWGKPRSLKVLDIVNPQSYREFLLGSFERTRTPLWMLNAERPVGQGTLQALLVLEREGHRLPPAGGVFAQAANADRPRAPGRSRYRDLEPGVRYSFNRHGWALTLNALRHRDDWPVWRLAEGGERLALAPRMTTVGASVAKTYGAYALRVEATYSDRRHFFATSSDGIHASPEIASVIGVAWTAFANTELNVQLFQTSTPDHAATMTRDETEMTAVLAAECNFPGTGLAASLTTHHGLSGQGALIRPRLTWQAGKALSVILFADLFEGRDDAFYGQFDHRDRVGLTLQLATF